MLRIFSILCCFHYFLITNCNDLVENEEYRCDLPCEQTCETLNMMIPCYGRKTCMNLCKPGYVRNKADGTCIRPFECPSCAANETYKGEGKDCLTCQNYQTIKCRHIYKRKCYCQPGYVRNARGQCILPVDCPIEENIICKDPNEKFVPCFTKECEKTCSNRDRKRFCPMDCQNHGCICKAGFIRNEENGKCIDEQSCPSY